MRYIVPFFLFIFVILWSSCRNDFETIPSTGQLQFSRDTVFLDTVFSNISTATYSFKVYNRGNEDISIPNVRLQNGNNSKFRLNVNGSSGTTFTDVTIFAKDSIFVFVESTADIKELTPDQKEFLLTDKVLFDIESRQQDVDLVTLVKDAVFLFPQRLDTRGTTESLVLGQNEDGEDIEIQGFVLEDDELTFTNEKPYVIYGYALVPNDKTLTIEAGARIHFHEGSGLLVANEGTLKVNGTLSPDPKKPFENQVIFQGDRLGSGNIFDEEPGSDFKDIAGQWGLIWLLSGNSKHEINYATILNSTVGILMDANANNATPSLDIKNSQIYNSTIAGIIARNWTVTGENLVIGNSGEASLNCSLGGTYNFEHCTFTNYWNNSSRKFPSVLLSNALVTGPNTVITAPLQEANFSNCIIYGNEEAEIGFDRAMDIPLNYNFQNCLIRFEEEDLKIPEEDKELYDFTNTALYQNIILNESPNFKDVEKNLFNIGDASAANGKATVLGMGTDILGTTRNATAPDIGAYESVSFEKNDD